MERPIQEITQKTAQSYLEESLGAQAVGLKMTSSGTGEYIPIIELVQCAQKTAKMLSELEKGAHCDVTTTEAGLIQVRVGEVTELFTFPKTTEERVA